MPDALEFKRYQVKRTPKGAMSTTSAATQVVVIRGPNPVAWPLMGDGLMNA